MSEDKAKSSSPVEPFLQLLKNAHGAGAVSILKQAMEDPHVYVFKELLELPNVRELGKGPHAPLYNLLFLFAFGTYQESKALEAPLPELSETQLKKLRLLTIITLATKNKCIPYSVLLNELEIPDVRQLENLIIEGIHADLFRGKLDQKNQRLDMEYVQGRDFLTPAFSQMTYVLSE